MIKKKKRKNERKKHTDEKGSGKSPFLSATNYGERKPMRRDEGMKK